MMHRLYCINVQYQTGIMAANDVRVRAAVRQAAFDVMLSEGIGAINAFKALLVSRAAEA
jgi:hypothetical protein